eukprot:scaffold255376_cov33-Tisochrysis_lutea.AAC.2
MSSMRRSLSCSRGEATPFTKQDIADRYPVISTSVNNVSACERASRRAIVQSSANVSRKSGAFGPPRTSTISRVNLNGAACSNAARPPGARPSTKPKSMWMRCPSRSSRMLPLCLSLIPRMYVAIE